MTYICYDWPSAKCWSGVPKAKVPLFSLMGTWVPSASCCPPQFTLSLNAGGLLCDLSVTGHCYIPAQMPQGYHSVPKHIDKSSQSSTPDQKS